MNLDGRNLSPEMRGDDVRRLQEELSQLGFAVNISGFFDSGTFIAVEQFQLAHNLDPTGTVDEETARLINVEVDAQTGDPYIVRGKVRQADGTPVGGMAVRLFKKRLREDDLIEQTTSDRLGNYEITYRPDETPISIFVDVAAPGAATLATSTVICSAQPVEIVDLTTDGEYRGPSELKQLQDKLLPILRGEGVAVNDLTEEDISLLACKHDLNAEQVAYFVVSARLAIESNFRAEPFYALLRQGLPPVLGALIAQDSGILEDALTASVRENIVSASLQEEIPDILDHLQREIVRLALREPTRDRPTLRAYFNLSRIPEARQTTLVEKYINYDGSPQEFWQNLRAEDGFDNAEIDRVQDTLRIATISLNHLPLTNRLSRLYDSQDRVSLRSFLGRLQPEQWRELLAETVDGEQIGAPAIFGDDEDAAVSQYAVFLPRMVEAAYPTAVLSAQLSQLDGDRFAPVTQFLDRTELELRDTRLADYLRDHPDEFDADNDADTLQLLKTTERLFKISPAFNKSRVISGLLSREVDNAIKIRRQGVVKFTRENTDLFENPIEAQQTYSRAARLADTALYVMSQSSQFNPVTVAAIPHFPIDSVPSAAGIPDLSDLFGQLDFCQCEHCASVYSPAAYLVDALHFLMNRLDDDGRPLLDVLFDRRPDIGLIELTCENTNTPLPYVDLVLEILENAVASEDNTGNIQLPTDESGDPLWFQTTEDADILGAIPEHTNPEAYRVLAGAVYPWPLPFDLWAEEARVYLNNLGVQRYELMEHFRSGEEPSIEVAAERLGLTPRDRAIITGTAPETTQQFWGLSPTAWNNLLSDRSVRVVLRQADLTYDELTALIGVDFLSVGGPLNIQFEQPNCNLDEAILANLNETVLDRMHRFVRLQRKLGWDTAELGMVLRGLGASDLSDDVLIQLAHIQRLKQDYKIKLETLLSWWAERLDGVRREDEVRSLYEQVFLDPTINNPKLEDFEIDTLNANPGRTFEDPDYAAITHGALGISADDLTRLISEALPDNALSLANLTHLYQATTLAKTLKLSVVDYLSIRSITGLDPFLMTQSDAVWHFIQWVNLVKDAGFSVAELDYLLRHQFVQTAAITTGDDEVTRFLEILREGLQQLEREYSQLEEETLSRQLSTHLEAVIPSKATSRIMALLNLVEGKERESQAEQAALINEYTGDFLDVTEAQENLVGEGTLENPGALTTNETRFSYVLSALLQYLKARARRSLIVQSLATAIASERSIAEALLTQWVTIPSDETVAAIALFQTDELISADSGEPTEITLATFPEQYEVFRRLEKSAIALNTLEIPPEAIEFLFTHADDIGWLNLNGLPLDSADADPTFFERWAKMTKSLLAAKSLPGGLSVFFSLLKALHSADVDNPLTRADFLSLLSERAGWSVVDLDFLTGDDGFAYAFPADFLDGAWLFRLQSCFALLHRLGVTAEEAWAWATVFGNLSEAAMGRAEAIARKIKQTVRGKYSEAQWLSLAKPLRDKLREQQRAAAVSYLVHEITSPAPLRNANDLYEKYLIDVEMDPCMMTSRIKQAISSVQLFVQRCTMNLEPAVELTADDVKEWAWMKNYRVWEANRKVFLYPENWIEPGLRDNKTELFKELESGLLQDETTDAVVERELLKYLKQLNNIANLEISGLYYEGEVHRQVVHVIGRTKNTPHLYYYRQWRDRRYWTPWERINVDIEGDHLVPVVWNRRLYIFWPMFLEKAVQPTTFDSDDPTPPSKYYEIKMLWSEYRDRQWQPKKMTDVFLVTFPTHETLRKKDFSFWATIEREKGLTIYTFSQQLNVPFSEDNKVGYQFRFANCEGRLEPVYALLPTRITEAPPKTQSYFNAFRQQANKRTLELATSASFPGPLAPQTTEETVVVFGNTPSRFSIMPSHAERPLQSRLPFFYQDNARTFFVIPRGKYTSANGGGGFTDIDSLAFGLNRDNAIPLELPDSFVRITANYLNAQTTISGAEPNPEENSNLTSRPSREIVRPSQPFEASTALVNNLASEQDLNLIQTRAVLSSSRATARASIAKSWEAKYFRFENFYHPYVCLLIEQLERHGISGIFEPDAKKEPKASKRDDVAALHRQTNSKAVLYQYAPNTKVVDNVYNINNILALLLAGPLEEFDFSYAGGYSIYNWEFFFHAPFMLAKKLSQNQKFADAQKWFHYIFNPLYVPPPNTSGEGRPARFWQIKPFFEQGKGEPIQQTMLLLKSSGLSKQEKEDRKRLRDQIEDWRKNPFNPHLIARLRPEAYMKSVVMAYIDNLIDWGDQLFSRDTIESINEATQIYILAANILGDRPQQISTPEDVRKTINGEEVKTFNDLRGRLDAFSNVLVELVDIVEPMESDPGKNPGISNLLGSTDFASPTADDDDDDGPELGFSAIAPDEVDPPRFVPEFPLATPIPVILGPTLFFCIPQNDKLLGYWDTVEDRLFKIRHCMNIEGVVRQLPLFEPPIDPGALVKAAAAGVDIGSVLDDLNAPLPNYRFQTIQQKANELLNEVKSLGTALLSALEKKDAEALAFLRSSHELKLTRQIRELKEKAIEEAEENKNSISSSRESVLARQAHYERLKEDGLSNQEKKHLERLETAFALTATGEALKLLAGALGLIPDFPIGINGAFSTPVVEVVFGGTNLTKAADLGIGALEFTASIESYLANKASIQAGHNRRAQDWDFQLTLAAKELEQLNQQVLAADVRIKIAEKDLENQDTQIENAEEAQEYLSSKYTNEALYSWMLSQISGVYFQSYQLAYDLAKRAEKTFRYELGIEDTDYIQFGYWDNLKKGLLAGEKLQHDLRRLELAYLEQHKREYEITKHISFNVLDPIAILTLKETGQCYVNIPEFLFDIDHPGHYLRRIKSISLTIPCVTGPYTSVSATLTLMGNRIRKQTSNSIATGEYVWDGNFEDSRFNYNLGGIQSIATSSAQNDSGLFELNFRDERYLPFEGAGAISQWRLELPNEFRQFDYNTITDVILHMNYMARQGGDALKSAATDHVTTVIDDATQGTSLMRMFSAKQEFPSEWHQFLHPEVEGTTPTLEMALSKNRFPFHFKNKAIEISSIVLYLKFKEGESSNTLPEIRLTSPEGVVAGDNQTFAEDPTLGLPQVEIESSHQVTDPNTWLLEAIEGSVDAIDDIFIVCRYTVS